MKKRKKRGESGFSASGQIGSAGLEAQLGWCFQRAELLRLALTHRSYAYEERGGAAFDEGLAQGKNPPGEDNEQLEFVGDAVLGLVVTEALYREFPECTEGELTRMRASLVSRERMAQLGAALELDSLLLLGKSAERTGSRGKPALLANAAEAVLAAVYLDAGKQGLEAIRRIVQQHLLDPELPALRDALKKSAGHDMLRDSKTLLQERVQAERAGKLLYVDAAESGPAHQRRFLVEARLHNASGERTLAAAEGGSKKEAQQRAAALALADWVSSPQASTSQSSASMPNEAA